MSAGGRPAEGEPAGQKAGPARTGRPVLKLPPRLGIALAALAAIAAIAIPLATSSLLRQSAAEAREGDFAAALREARSAQNVQPGAAAPRLQQALVLEQIGDLPGAATAAHAYGRARCLNPHHSLFER